jgi:hypothetical protein
MLLLAVSQASNICCLWKLCWQPPDRLLLLSTLLHSSLEALDWDTSAAAAAAGNQLEAGDSGTLGSPTLLQLLPPSVRLYQIVSPGLIGRAALFGCKLALPANWRCIDPAYFDGEHGCCTTHTSSTFKCTGACCIEPAYFNGLIAAVFALLSSC